MMPQNLNMVCHWFIFLLKGKKLSSLLSLDLLTIGIWNTAQPNGLVVPDASMYSVNSMADVLELMNIGLMNRATSATALNERSSRSHRFCYTLLIYFAYALLFQFLVYEINLLCVII